MSTDTSLRASGLGRALEAIAIAAMVLIGLNVAVVAVGVARPFSVRSELAFPVDFGDRLRVIETQDGSRDAASGLPPVELGGPVEAELTFLSPTTSQRVIWAIGELVGPALALAGIWTIYRVVRSARAAEVFTSANERRLWSLAFLIAVGGTIESMISGFTDLLLIQRSAAADLFLVSSTISFLPLVVGMLVAMLASVWRLGVSMREDLEGTI